jgi:methylmalonyl-CoA/ethylmalonyl-CoA epimerase
VEPTKIHHIGIAVTDLEEAQQIYAAMGLTVEQVVRVPDEQVAVAWIPIGESRIELLQPTNADSPVAKFLKERGPGLHHVALEVEDIEAALQDCTRNRLRAIDPALREGAEGQVAFLHPRSTAGVLIELIQPASEKEP